MRTKSVFNPRRTAAGASGRTPSRTWASMLNDNKPKNFRVSIHYDGKVFIGACSLGDVYYIPTEEVENGMRRMAYYGRPVGNQPVQRMTERDAWINEAGYQYLLNMVGEPV